jgi:hypothetical protein
MYRQGGRRGKKEELVRRRWLRDAKIWNWYGEEFLLTARSSA